jgi:hypothetical protein
MNTDEINAAGVAKPTDGDCNPLIHRSSPEAGDLKCRFTSLVVRIAVTILKNYAARASLKLNAPFADRPE